MATTSSTLTNSKSYSAIIAHCSVNTLNRTLKCGNKTDGYNIILSTNDSIIGETDLTLASTGESSNINLTPGDLGQVIINGNLNVSELIDTTGIILSDSTAPPTLVDEGALFVSDGSSGNGNKNQLYYRNESNGSFRLLGGPPNEIIITTLTDFPTPVAEVITLDGTKHYRISGIVNIGTNRIESNGAILISGTILTLDRIITNNATALIRQYNGFPVQINEVLFTNTGGPVYDIDGLNAATSNIHLERNPITLSTSVGTIKNTSRFYFSDSALLNCANGITIDGSHNIISIVDIGVPSATSTFTGVTIPSTAQIGTMRMTDSNFTVSSGQTAFNISASAVVTNPPIRIDDVVIEGDGTALTGITKANKYYEFFQCIGILNSLVFGSVGYSSSTPNVITTTNNTGFFDISGNYTLSSTSERFDLSANSHNGELVYNGVKNISVVINLKFSASGGANNIDYILATYCQIPGGVWEECPDSSFYQSASKDRASFGTSECIALMSPGKRIKPVIKTPSHPIGTTLNVYAIRFDAITLSM
jgi:hypothetical protein